MAEHTCELWGLDFFAYFLGQCQKVSPTETYAKKILKNYTNEWAQI